MILRKRAEKILDLVKRTESEISLSDETIIGDVYIGAGETDTIRYIAKAAYHLQQSYPQVRFHIKGSYYGKTN